MKKVQQHHRSLPPTESEIEEQIWMVCRCRGWRREDDHHHEKLKTKLVTGGEAEHTGPQTEARSSQQLKENAAVVPEKMQMRQSDLISEVLLPWDLCLGEKLLSSQSLI